MKTYFVHYREVITKQLYLKTFHNINFDECYNAAKAFAIVNNLEIEKIKQTK